MTDKPFWEIKKLKDFNQDEWESICDNCGKCCLIKIIDEDTNELHYTNVACHLLNFKSCQCNNYKDRKKIVPDCVKLTPQNLEKLDWMPTTCSYKLLNEGNELPHWHPLIQNSRKKMDEENHSILNKVTSEKNINKKNMARYIHKWD